MWTLKSALAKPFAAHIFRKVKKWADNPIKTQEIVFEKLISQAAGTQFGKDHDFISINSHIIQFYHIIIDKKLIISRK